MSNMNKGFLIAIMFLVLTSLFLVGCKNNEITGAAISSATLTVTVKDEKGVLLEEAEIYVNDEYRGQTAVYGQFQGKRNIVINEVNNVIKVEKEGYTVSEPLLVKLANGDQSITFSLSKKRTNYKLRVQEEGRPMIGGVKVTLLKDRNKVLEELSDEEGEVTFSNLNDGKYNVRLSKNSYEEQEFNIDIDYSTVGDWETETIVLKKLPTLVVMINDERRNSLEGVKVALYKKEDYIGTNSKALSIKRTGGEGVVGFKATSLDESYVVVAQKSGFANKVRMIEFNDLDQEFLIVLQKS